MSNIALRFIDNKENPLGVFKFKMLDSETMVELTNKYNKYDSSHSKEFKILGESVRQMKSVGGIVGMYNSYPAFYLVEYESRRYLMKNLAHGQNIIGIEEF